jgi:hypothetical protein
MKTIKQKLIFLGALIISSLIVIGGLRLNTFTYPVIWIFFPVLIHSLFLKFKSLLTKILFSLFVVAYGANFAVFLLRFVLCGYGPTHIFEIIKMRSEER